MTSNAGTGGGEANVGFGATLEGTQQSILNQLGDYFKPEFLNRFDAIVEFNALSKENLLGIVEIMLDEINDSMADHDIQIHVDQEAKEKLVDLGYNPDMGARPLRRVIEEQIEDKIAEFYLDNPDVGEINVTVNDDDEIIVEKDAEVAEENNSENAEAADDTDKNAEENSDEETDEE